MCKIRDSIGKAVSELKGNGQYSITKVAETLKVSEQTVEEFIRDGRLMAARLRTRGLIKVFGARIKEFYALYSDGKGGYNTRPNTLRDYYTAVEAAAVLGKSTQETEEMMSCGKFDFGGAFAFRLYKHGDTSQFTRMIPKYGVRRVMKELAAEARRKESKGTTVTDEAGTRFCNVRRTAYMLDISEPQVRDLVKYGYFGTGVIKEEPSQGLPRGRWLISEKAIYDYAHKNGIFVELPEDDQKENYHQVTIPEEETLSIMAAEDHGDTKAEFEQAEPEDKPRWDDSTAELFRAAVQETVNENMRECMQEFIQFLYGVLKKYQSDGGQDNDQLREN